MASADPAPHPPREPNARGEGVHLRRQLVAAASRLLLSPQPVSLPSLRAVARACAVSPAAVYLHFDSVQALIAAVIDTQIDELAVALRSALSSAPASDRLAAFAHAYVEWGLQHPGSYQLLFETADRLSDAGAEVHDNWAVMREAVVLVVDATSASPPVAERLAFRLWSSLHGLVSLRLHKPDVEWPQDHVVVVEETVVDLLERATRERRQ